MQRTVNLLIVTIGMTIGAWIPTLFGASFFGLWGVLGTTIGGIAGIYVILKFNR